ncbi:Uu.00g136600.m01.CDS01 [Anthostomella pinea]|uniref:Uu.00g136600.m01.CDS01 n=1 Tax=Anthostomella pinea TaxID=933095 RepID=A0AAI8VIX5_9PEZI|nr:Uu.00g136600.m01.CDS01 [Anthostomella pinea]
MFIELRNHVWDLRVQFWEGYSQRDLELDQLKENYASAVQEATKQPQSLNSLCFTYERELGRYKRQIASARARDPTTVLLLTGSPLQQVEADAIIRLQEGVKMDKTDKPGKVSDQGNLFCIQTIAWTQHIEKADLACLHTINNYFKGKRDINDLTEIIDSEFGKFGPSAKLLLKVLNSHNTEIDHITISPGVKYGNTGLVSPNDKSLELPTFDNVVKVME